MPATCAPRLEIRALPDLPIIQPGDDLAEILACTLERAGMGLESSDVLVVTSKLVSRAEDRFVDVSTIEPGPRARELAVTTVMDARLVELILGESVAVSRAAPHALIVRHRLGFISANAGIDMSNARPPGAAAGAGPWALLMPRDPDATAEHIRDALSQRHDVAIGVIISDSFGRPFRLGTVGTAIGVAGVPALNDMRGQLDLVGRALEHTETALADQIAAAADLVAGQGAESRGAVLVRGLEFAPGSYSARLLLRPAEGDLYA
jgi:coenzyme F420-0:L-glutamate ligase/coenzyme F420-1:gamma-L-glutamate ligase